MNSSIKHNPIVEHLAEDFLADNEDSKARLKLVFIVALFVSCWVIGSGGFSEVIANNPGVSLLGTLLGM